MIQNDKAIMIQVSFDNQVNWLNFNETSFNHRYKRNIETSFNHILHDYLLQNLYDFIEFIKRLEHQVFPSGPPP